MSHDQLFNLINARPFRPYTLHTAGGRAIKITHPELLAYGGSRTAVVVRGNHWEVLDIHLIESVEGQDDEEEK